MFSRSNPISTRGGSLLLGLALTAVAGLFGPVLGAQEEDTSPNSSARLIPEVSAIQPGESFTVAILIEMDPGWHSYWKNAGDSGLPTEMDWDLPEGFSPGEIQWPYPERIVAYPLVDYGYSHEVALLVDIEPPTELEGGSTVRLAGRVDWLICERICLPAFQEVEVDVRVSAEAHRAAPEWAGLFLETRDRIPKPLPEWELSAEVTETGYRLEVDATGEGVEPPEEVYFFAGQSSVIAHSQPQAFTRRAGGFTLELVGSPYATQPITPLSGVLMVEDGGSWDPAGEVVAMAVEVAVAGAPARVEPSPASQPTPMPPPQTDLTLLLALVFSLVGGALLNLMPCVFPVLSLKILGAVGQGGEDRKEIRNQGLAFGVGVVISFLALAGVLITLRTAGAQLGWGFQLQSPIFVAAIAALFFAIGLNLMGVFEVGASLTRLGNKPGTPSGYGESLASGVLATVIATPCTAPFMGAALGFALTRSIPETLLVFGVLGFGMALPYGVLSTAPGLLERLPRPGPWMETMKQVMAFPMFGTVIWLVWVFGQQTGVGGATFLLMALLLIGGAGWMVGRWPRMDLRSGRTARAVSLAVLALAGLAVIRGSSQEAPLLEAGGDWRAYSPEALATTLSNGQPAFVDFTAAWCLTCQVNERLVLSSETVLEAFKGNNVSLFKADWTRQDPVITSALEALGRSGVPVYALYSAGAGSEPHLLPAILTEQIVLDAVSKIPF